MTSIHNGNVIDLQKHRRIKAAQSCSAMIGSGNRAESEFFAAGKFLPFAQAYIDCGFVTDVPPTIQLQVAFRDYRPRGEAAALLKQLQAQQFDIREKKYARGYAPRTNPKGEFYGPLALKAVSMDEARELFAQRENSPFGAYQPSARGFRNISATNWDARGVGFYLAVSGEDPRRSDNHGHSTTFECHIIDNERDMQEVIEMTARIRRAQLAMVRHG